jgi:ketosteroid isomerase-like protein
MKKLLWYPVLITMLLFLSGSSLQKGEDEDIEEVRKAIEELNAKFINSCIDNDLEVYLSLYADDAIVMPPFHPAIKGKQELINGWHKQRMDGTKFLSATATILEIWTSENMVYERGSFGMTLTTKHSSKPYSIYGSYFTIWQKQSDGTYKIKYDISNLDHGV